MLKLGNSKHEQIKADFLRKFRDQRDDADEYEFTTIKGEQLMTVIYHKECGQVFETRPYLFLQEKWAKRCPYCHNVKPSVLTETHIRERIESLSDGNLELVRHEIDYHGKQKTHHVTVKCLDCNYEHTRYLQNIRNPFRCPECGNKK